jgi:hypothetical protein
MYERAFKILGIEPTTDGRVIRSAFVRLARIYHPDRFSGMPNDVRAEAERRMKEATEAYEQLRGARTAIAAAAQGVTRRTKNGKDPWDEVRRAREEVAARRAEQERSKARWLLWEELERQARQRAEEEAHLAIVLDEDIPPPDRPPEDSPVCARSSFARRLDEARQAQNGSEVPARRASD